MSSRNTRVALVSIVAATCLTGALASAAWSEEPPEPAAATFRDLERVPSNQDKLPVWFAELPIASEMNLGSARWLMAEGANDYYLIRGRSNTTCLIFIASDGSSGGSCAETSTIAKNGLYIMEVADDPTETLTAVAIPDGADSVVGGSGQETVGRSASAVVMKGQPSDTLTVKTRGRADVRISLGDVAPPE